MKILHVIPSMSVHDGGPPRAVRAMARAMAELGHEVDVFTTNLTRLDESARRADSVESEGRASIHFFGIDWPRPWLRSIAMGRALEATVPRCDIVIIHALYHYHLWAAARACRRHRVPYVVRPLGTLDPFMYRRSRWKKAPLEFFHQNRDLRLAAAIQYTTREEAELAQPYSQGATSLVLPLGVWLDCAEPDVEPVTQSGEPRALYLGRLHPKKGIELLLEAMASLAVPSPRLRLDIAGSGNQEYVQGLKTLSETLGLAERVRFCGFVDGAAKRQLLEQADLFVLPSHSENFGIAVIEAAAARLPLLISDKVNLASAVDAAEAGWVFADDQQGVDAGLRQALEARADWPALGANALRMVREQFDWRALAKRYEAAYRELVDMAG